MPLYMKISQNINKPKRHLITFHKSNADEIIVHFLFT